MYDIVYFASNEMKRYTPLIWHNWSALNYASNLSHFKSMHNHSSFRLLKDKLKTANQNRILIYDCNGSYY